MIAIPLAGTGPWAEVDAFYVSKLRPAPAPPRTVPATPKAQSIPRVPLGAEERRRCLTVKLRLVRKWKQIRDFGAKLDGLYKQVEDKTVLYPFDRRIELEKKYVLDLRKQARGQYAPWTLVGPMEEQAQQAVERAFAALCEAIGPVGEVDWRPGETIPEDLYALGARR